MCSKVGQCQLLNGLGVELTIISVSIYFLPKARCHTVLKTEDCSAYVEQNSFEMLKQFILATCHTSISNKACIIWVNLLVDMTVPWNKLFSLLLRIYFAQCPLSCVRSLATGEGLWFLIFLLFKSILVFVNWISLYFFNFF